MCPTHLAIHTENKSTKGHVVIEGAAASTMTTPAMCAEHPKQELIGCCRNCNKAPVCTLCLFGAHNAHKVCPLQQRPRMRIVSIQLSQYPQGLPIF